MALERQEKLNIAQRKHRGDWVVALAGNPNVGKSTVFNALTGLNQHTGNWPGKTVGCTQGRFVHGGTGFALVDIPGSYSLHAHSAEEEIARDYLLFGDVDMVVVVCDASCLERNMNLALQIIELEKPVVLCVNLLDEARKKHIRVDLPQLQAELGIPVVGMRARDGVGLPALKQALQTLANTAKPPTPRLPTYSPQVEHALAGIMEDLPAGLGSRRFIGLQILQGDLALLRKLDEALALSFPQPADATLQLHEEMQAAIAQGRFALAEQICARCVRHLNPKYLARQLHIDRFLTRRSTGLPVMLLLLALVLWLTIVGANYPSQLLSRALFALGDWLLVGLTRLHAPQWLCGLLVDGVYRVLAWVVSVMLPPMAIFFPLFTLLEDVGYLPRIAFNLDHVFARCNACGKQALTMCMGFGCNAAGVTACRIIDSKRERMIAILTNSLVPCNGRFPGLIAIISMFFAFGSGGMLSSAVSALLLCLAVLLCVGLTFLSSKLLSVTVLKGMPSSFVLEMPPFRRPQIGRVLVRSLLDRSLFVLGRAALVAAPAGLVIWLLGNVHLGGLSLLAHLSGFFDPLGRLLGMDGIILVAFILGFPANEIVIPLILMGYLASGSIVEMASLGALKALLLANGWTGTTALCTLAFMLLHWPCSTTLLTIKKETGSLSWTALAALLPTALGAVLCAGIAALSRLLG